MDPLSSSTQSPQITLVEAGRIENLEEGPFAHTPIDLQVMLCWELFITDMKSLPSLFCICQAMNNMCRRKFLTACEKRIVEYVQSQISQTEKHAAICRAFGAMTPTPMIIELVGQLEFDDSLPLHPFPTSLPPRLFCTKLSIKLNDNKALLSEITSKRLPFLKELRIASLHMTDVLLDNIAVGCPELDKLHIETSAQRLSFSGSSSFASLTGLQLVDCTSFQSDAHIRNIARRCPKLTILSTFATMIPCMPSQTRITREGLTSLADGCPHMVMLALSHCHDITGADLETFAKKCPSISKIILGGAELPSVRDSVQLLLTAPTLSLLEIIQEIEMNPETFESLFHSAVAILEKKTIPQVVECFCACAMLGLYDRTLFMALIYRLHCEYTSPSLVEQVKIRWACKKLGINHADDFLPELKQGKKLYEEVESELNEQDLPENRQANRKNAAATIMDILEPFPKD